MNFEAHNIYHIYNRGNQKQAIFFTEANYIYFLQKVRKCVAPKCDILAYVLMPNHFHFLIYANHKTSQLPTSSKISTNSLSEGFRLLLSSYTRGVNKQEGRVGNLIQQNTKSKCVTQNQQKNQMNYGLTCFDYIHQNPLKAGLVGKIEEWPYSSYRDYSGLRNGTLCNQELAKRVLDIPKDVLISSRPLSDDLVKNIW